MRQQVVIRQVIVEVTKSVAVQGLYSMKFYSVHQLGRSFLVELVRVLGLHERVVSTVGQGALLRVEPWVPVSSLMP
jgi:hypothetical protein